MALGTYTLKAKGKAASFDPRVNHGKPLIVVPREFRANFTTQRFPNPKDVVIVDVVDLLADTVHVSVIWGGGAMVDALKEHVPAEGQEPTKLPVVIQPTQSAAGNSYFVLAPLEGPAVQLAAAWDAKFPARIDQERAQHEAAQVSAPGAPAADPMAAALAALQGGPTQLHSQPLGGLAAALQGGGAPAVGYQPAPAAAAQPAQNDAAAQVAALQAQLATALAAQGQAPAAPVQPAAPAAPAMSDADLEAAINALK